MTSYLFWCTFLDDVPPLLVYISWWRPTSFGVHLLMTSHLFWCTFIDDVLPLYWCTFIDDSKIGIHSHYPFPTKWVRYHTPFCIPLPPLPIGLKWLSYIGTCILTPFRLSFYRLTVRLQGRLSPCRSSCFTCVYYDTRNDTYSILLSNPRLQWHLIV